jgi:redox-sensitive bicupin YhaK (pirin superfamily)
MTTYVRPQSMNRGAQFRAYALHAAELTNPFLGVDHAWMSGPTFPAHPHAGFSAVSYLFLDSQTGINNKDSLGGRHLIRPGGLHWTAAGRGVVHEEHPAENGKTVHMLQIFVNLERQKQSDAPFALHLPPEDVPVVNLSGATVRVPLGQFGNQQSPLSPPTEVTLLDIPLEAHAELEVPVAAGQTAFVLPIAGALSVNGERVESDGAPMPVMAAKAQANTITLNAQEGAVHVALFVGTPLQQPVYWGGPMAMASREALNNAMTAFQRGEFGKI